MEFTNYWSYRGNFRDQDKEAVRWGFRFIPGGYRADCRDGGGGSSGSGHTG
ncbi:hypothetical protein ACWGI8_28500 [Streptomyces sp. NPDC054841]